MAKQVVRIIVGLAIILFQLTANKNSVVPCVSAECIGYNLIGLGIWAGGIYFVVSGCARLFRRRTTPTSSPERT